MTQINISPIDNGWIAEVFRDGLVLIKVYKKTEHEAWLVAVDKINDILGELDK